MMLSSASFAGFFVTATLNSSANGFDRYDIVAVNTGINTGTQIKRLEYTYQGSPVAFEVQDVDENGVNDLVHLLSTSRTRIRVSSTPPANVYESMSPDGYGVEPNPYANPLSAFSGAIANTGTTQATGTGFQIARLFLPTGGSGVFSGNLGGEVGPKVPFYVDVTRDSPDYGLFVTSITPNPVDVVFGSSAGPRVPFSATVRVDGAPPYREVSFALTQTPDGIHNISIATTAEIRTHTFVVSGMVDYSLNSQTVDLPFRADCPGIFQPTAFGTIRLNITPEPSSLVALSLVGAMFTRKRGRRLHETHGTHGTPPIPGDA